MVEGEYVSIQEAARRCGVSGKTIQRAIQAGKLPAEYPKPNQCQIAISDLERFRPGQLSGQTTDLLESRIAGLEERIGQLEHLVAALLSKQEASKPKRMRKAQERTTGPLPRHLVSLLAFANHHNVSEQKVLAHVNINIPLLKAVRGVWTDAGGTVITLALDSSGRAAFYRVYHNVPPFVECQDCPH